MKDIVIIGSGFGREIAWLIDDINKDKKEWNIIGYVDDNDSIQHSVINGIEVIGKVDWLMDKEYYVINAIADPIIKKIVLKKLEKSKNIYPILIHPNVICSDTSKLDEGTVICAGNILSIDMRIGKHVIVNLGCTLGHDAIIGDYSTIFPGVNVSGHVDVGECVSIGTGTAIIQGVSIGDNTIVGAGSVVVKDLPANCTAVGSPAKPIKYRDQPRQTLSAVRFEEHNSKAE